MNTEVTHMLNKKIMQNLIDAGCDETTIKQYDLCSEKNNRLKFSILAKHRKNLLNTIHITQKQLDCLDYLTYQLKNNKSV